MKEQRKKRREKKTENKKLKKIIHERKNHGANTNFSWRLYAIGVDEPTSYITFNTNVRLYLHEGRVTHPAGITLIVRSFFRHGFVRVTDVIIFVSKFVDWTG